MFKRSRPYNASKSGKFIEEVISYRREILSIILISFIIFLLLSLLSFSPADNSFFYYSSVNDFHLNWCGAVGAYLSSLFLFLFGSASFLVVLLISFLTILLLFGMSFKQQLGRIFTASGLVLVITLLLNAHGIDFTKSFPGGFVGFSLMNFFGFFLGKSGTLILSYAFIWIGFIILLRISFVSLLAIMGGVLRTFLSFLGNIIFKAGAFVGVLWTRKNKGEGEITQIEGASIDDKEEGFWEQVGQSCKDENLNVTEESVVLETENKKSSWFLNGINFERWRGYEVFEQGRDGQELFGRRILAFRNSVLAKNIFVFFGNKNIISRKTGLSGELEKQTVIGKKPRIEYRLPDSTIFALHRSKEKVNKKIVEEECKEKAKKLEEKLLYFGIEGSVSAIRPGPVITLFEYTPAIGTKISKIIALEDDLAMVLKAMSIRIIAPIPGRSVIGFEISNKERENVKLVDILSTTDFTKTKAILPLALGVDIVGSAVVEDLSKMPHLLVAGSTGSGKSVALNTMLASLLCYLSPEKLKIILVDPKHLEFASYKDIPHLLFPIVTDLRRITCALKWAVSEMERRYEKMAKFGVRNLEDYHLKLKRLRREQDVSLLDEVEDLPFIVIMIDELADLMMISGKEVEACITRLAQMARAAGIYLVVATQRPSVDVLTGIIKVNFPSRVAFRVSSKIDSKVILDSTGAEKLLGRGDMLYLNPRFSDLRRVHGAHISDEEITKLVNYLRSQRQVDYLDLEEIVENSNKIVGVVWKDS